MTSRSRLSGRISGAISWIRPLRKCQVSVSLILSGVETDICDSGFKDGVFDDDLESYLRDEYLDDSFADDSDACDPDEFESESDMFYIYNEDFISQRCVKMVPI